MEVLDRRTMNRCTLARQWLLLRQPRSPLEAVAHLVGLQAQEPQEPYVALWSRLAGFDAAAASADLEQRRTVRTLMMRRTLHLMTAEDCLALRPWHDAMLRARMRGTLGPRLPGVDVDELATVGRPLFAERPRMLTEVGRVVGERWPEASPRDLGDALSTLVRLVQVPPRGLWRGTGSALNTTVEGWLGEEPGEPVEAVLDELVLRYLRSFGPASSSDVRAWSGLTGLPAVIKRLRPRLVSYRDEAGRELLDVAGLDIVPAQTPAPVRFLPAFDNVVLGYADRSRVIDDEHRRLSVAGARFVLVDGRVAGTWSHTPVEDGDGGVVTVSPLRRLARTAWDEVEGEGTALAGFLGDGVTGRFAAVPY